jgi:hypothetical protein
MAVKSTPDTPEVQLLRRRLIALRAQRRRRERPGKSSVHAVVEYSEAVPIRNRYLSRL